MNFYAGIYGLATSNTRTRTAELLDLAGLRPYLAVRAGRLSNGWKQRLALVCSLLHRPRLVFLDEPTAGVDPVARRELWELLFRLAAGGLTFFVTTHYMDEAERCGRVGYLYNSHLLTVGTPQELKASPAVTPAGTHRLEMAGPQSAELLTWLRGQPGVREATIFGDAIHTLVDDDFATDELRRRGATVDVVTVYRTVKALVGSIGEILETERVDCIVFTSPSTIPEDLHMLPTGTALAVIGPVTREAALLVGLKPDIVPGESTIPALVKAIRDHFELRT